MRLFLVITLVSVLFMASLAARSKPKNCDRKLVSMDKAIEKALIVTNPDMRPWESTDDFKSTWCDNYKGWMKQMTAVKNCLENFQKTIFNIVILNMKRSGRTHCDSTEAQKKVVEHSKCLAGDRVDKLKSLANRVTIITEYVADLDDTEEMIPGLCCGFQIVLKKIETEASAICDKTTGKKTGKFIRGLVNDAVADAIEIMCGQYETIDVCKEKVPDKMVELEEVLDTDTPTVYNHTAFPSLLRFIKQLDSSVNF